MATRTARLTANRGDNTTFNIFVVRPGTNSYLDLNNLLTATFTVREFQTSPTILFQKSIGNGITVSPTTTGLLTVTVAPSDLPDINRTRSLYVYDVELNIDGLGVFTAQTGTLEVSGTVSRQGENVVLNAPVVPGTPTSTVVGLPENGVDGDLLFKSTNAQGAAVWRSPDSLQLGVSWLTGDGPPNETLGDNGDFYYDIANIAIYGPKFEGQWGIPVGLVPDLNSLIPLGGSQGQVLIKQTNQDRDTTWGTVAGAGGSGNTILSGSGSPESDLGEDGDFYFDVVNNSYYGPKTAGTWGPATSLVGPQGDPGIPGTDGVDGLDGRTILNGIGAPPGGTGVDGDFYLDTSSGDLYGPRNNGDWPPTPLSLVGPAGQDGQNGINGTNGVDGEDGVDGSQILSGSGVPSDGLGANGDFYLDSDTGDYYLKAAGTWGAAQGTLAGPQGEQGIPGINGADGADGVDGAPGTPGAAGAAFLSGSGVPGSGLGVDGDSYVDTDDGAVYQKITGTWIATGGSIRGPQGLPGADGVDGQDGAPGPGYPPGGAVNDVLKKLSGADGDFGVGPLQIDNIPGLTTDLAGKAPLVHTHVIADVTGLQPAIDSKADDAATTSSLAGKADLEHTHVIADVTGLQTAIDSKADDAATTAALASKSGVAHTHVIANVAGLQTAIDSKADDAATTAALAGKSDLAHTHVIEDVTGLQSSLDNKVNLGDATGQFAFSTREIAQSSTVSSTVQTIQVEHDGHTLTYVKDSAGTALTTNGGTQNWRPAEQPSVAHYGAVNDASTDNSAAFNAAIAAHDVVYINPTPANENNSNFAGYRIGNPVLLRNGVTVYGTGSYSSVIRSMSSLGNKPVFARPSWADPEAAGVNDVTLQGFKIIDFSNTDRTDVWTVDLANGKNNKFIDFHIAGIASSDAHNNGVAVGRAWGSGFENTNAWVHFFHECKFVGAGILCNTSDSIISDCEIYAFGKSSAITIGDSQVDITQCTVSGGTTGAGVLIQSDSGAVIRHVSVSKLFMDGGSANDRIGLRSIQAVTPIEACSFVQCDGFNHGREVIRLEDATRCAIIGCMARQADNFDNGLPDIYVSGSHNYIAGNTFYRSGTCIKSGTFGLTEPRVNLGRSIQVIDVDGAAGTTTVFGNRAEGLGYLDIQNAEEFNLKRFGPVGSNNTAGGNVWQADMSTSALRITAAGTNPLEIDGRVRVAQSGADLDAAAALLADETLGVHSNSSNHMAFTGGSAEWGVNVSDSTGSLRLSRRSGAGSVEIGNIDISPGGSIEVQGTRRIDVQGCPVIPTFTNAQLADQADSVNTLQKAPGKLVVNSSTGALCYASGGGATDAWIVFAPGGAIAPA